jgi:hypothetical protein
VVGEDRRDDRQRGGHDERAADTHDRPRRDELAGRLRKGRGQRAEGEEAKAEGQRVVPAVPVRDGPGQQQQRGKGERVGVDDPLEPAAAGVQVPRERRQGHVDDRGVHHDHEQRKAEHPEGPPAPGVSPVRDSVHLKAPSVRLRLFC